MAGNFNIEFNQGLNTANAPENLKNGELQTAVGIYYKNGDPSRAWTINGRSEFGDTGESTEVPGLVLAQFDDGGTNRLLALADDTVYSATPGDTGSFTALISGLTTGAIIFGGVHTNDRYYVYNGIDQNYVIENDGTVRNDGMEPPTLAITIVSGVAGAVSRPTAAEGTGWDNPTKSFDSSSTTFASTTLSTSGNTTLVVSGFAPDASVNRSLYISYRLAGFQFNIENFLEKFGAGGTFWADFHTQVNIDYSTNNGSSWTNLLTEKFTTAMPQNVVIGKAISDAINSSLIQVRATLHYFKGKNQATLRLNDVKITTGAQGTAVTSQGGLIYALTEYDALRGMESDPGPQTGFINISGAAQAIVSGIPATARNTNTTHFRIYRTFDGGVFPDNLGLIGQVPVGDTLFTDDFDAVSVSTQPAPPLPLSEIQVEGGGTIRYPRNHKGPNAKHQNIFKASRVLVPVDSPRSLRYSVPNLPESFPEHFVIQGFPFLERDELVATMTVGGLLMIFSKYAVSVLNDLPLDVDGRFEARADLFLRDNGLVGPQALTTLNVGEPTYRAHGAWVSYDGIWLSDGNTAAKLTEDLDWEDGTDMPNKATLSTAQLFFDSQRQLLYFSYDSDGDSVNDRYLLVHMSPRHQKGTGPKITGPHYGKLRSLVAGYVDNEYKIYSGHASNGFVYLEWNGSEDESNSYDDDGTIPMSLKTPRVYSRNNFWTILRGNIRTSNFSSGDSLTITHTAGKDNPARTYTKNVTVNLGENGGRQFSINRTGEFHEFVVDHDGTSQGAILDMRCTVDQLDDAGDLSS